MGVVLCGGQSLRMGRDKAELAHPRGGTFLQHAIDRLTELCQIVAISTSPDRELPAANDVIRIDDPVSHHGPMVGVAECLRVASERGIDACLVTPVDTPDLTQADLQLLVQAWQSGSRLVCGVDQTSQTWQPLIAIYSTPFRQSLSSAARSEDRSLLRWLQRKRATEVVLSTDACRNVNFPTDLRE